MQRPIIDPVSFLLGFAAASIFWWLVRTLKAHFPRFRAAWLHQAELRRQRKLEGISRFVRQETIRRAQSAHLAQQLFPLDDILILPRLLAPPGFLLDPSGEHEDQRIAEQVIPYLPDWPELSAPFPVCTISAAQALSQGAHIALVGEPGSGRSVALAHLALVVARREPAAEGLENHTPILLHALDLDFNIDPGADPIDLMRQSLSRMTPVITAPQLPRYTRELFSNGGALLLIDGMDELAPTDLQMAAAYLKALLAAYPRTRIAVAASSDYMDGLVELGFFPLAVAGWDARDRQEYVQKWSSLWDRLIAPELQKRTTSKLPDPLLLTSWLTADPIVQTPVEWTLKVWAAYSGDAQGAGSLNALLAYVLRLNHKNIPVEALAELAYNIFCSGQSALPYELVEKSFTRYKPDQNASVEPQAEEPGMAPADSKAGKTRKPTRISSGSAALDALLDDGLLVESPDGKVRFSHQVFAGYLASLIFQPGQELPAMAKQRSALQNITLRYLAVQGKINPWVKQTIEKTDAPLYRNLLMVSRWLADAPPDLPWRSPVIRILIQKVQDDRAPLYLRARCLAGVVNANDESVGVLLKQLLESGSDIVRQMAAVACGASQQPKTTADLIKRLNDHNPQVARAACLSIGSFGTRLAFESMVDLLNTGEEGLQLAAAETLALMPDGGDVLRDAASSNELLVRRAAIAGLALLRNEWVEEVLEKIAIEDAQWIIRNAAAEALTVMRAPEVRVPRPLPPSDQSPWLIAYAGQHGTGLIPGEPVMEYLLSALRDGSTQERLHALQYLRALPQEPVMAAVTSALEDESQQVQDAAYFTLWQLSAGGSEMPAPHEFYE